jgi:disulfide bond formation protein DsbB
MDLFTEAGVFAYVGLIVFVGGLVAIVRGPKRAVTRGAAAAIIVMGLGMAGQGMGQRLVDRAVEAEPDNARKVALLSMGTREASANQLLAGLMALALIGVGLGVGAARGDD